MQRTTKQGTNAPPFRIGFVGYVVLLEQRKEGELMVDNVWHLGNMLRRADEV